MTTIRTVQPADAARVAELATQLGYPSTAADAARRIEALAANSQAVALVATDGDDVIGWIVVELSASLTGDDLAHIAGLVVDEVHRSAHVGQTLLTAGEAWARERGARTMTVASRVVRERAHRFYQREGYEHLKSSHIFTKSLV